MPYHLTDVIISSEIHICLKARDKFMILNKNRDTMADTVSVYLLVGP